MDYSNPAQAVSTSYSGPSFAEVYRQLGIGVPLSVLAAILLLIWLCILFSRLRTRSAYIVYVAASLYPAFVSVAIFAWSTVHYFFQLSNGGWGPEDPSTAFAYALLPLPCGFLLTCIFFPLGIAALVIRRPE